MRPSAAFETAPIHWYISVLREQTGVTNNKCHNNYYRVFYNEGRINPYLTIIFVATPIDFLQEGSYDAVLGTYV